MAETVYAVAQIQSYRENFTKNLDTHLRYIKMAAEQNADFILFPELSLTGYERELAANQSFTADAPQLDVLAQAAIEYHMVIVAGGPLRIENSLYIASWVFMPDGKKLNYIKKFLHPGEDLFFESRKDYDPMLLLNGERISFAICFDLENDEHIKKAVELNTSMYTASIFYSRNGISHGLQRLQQLAKQYHIPVLMSNYCGTCWDMEAGGSSSIWSEYGEIVVAAEGDTPCLLIAEQKEDVWQGRIVF